MDSDSVKDESINPTCQVNKLNLVVRICIVITPLKKPNGLQSLIAPDEIGGFIKHKMSQPYKVEFGILCQERNFDCLIIFAISNHPYSTPSVPTSPE